MDSFQTPDAENSDGAARLKPMRVLERAVYRGPHLFGREPMIRIQIDLGAAEGVNSATLPGFVDRLLATLPGLGEHGCSLHRPGGFVERLRDGTWMGHVAEHVALELQTLAGSPAARGKTRSVKGRPGVYNVLYTYRDEEVGLVAGRMALALVDGLLPEALRGVGGLELVHREAEAAAEPFELRRELARLTRLAARRTLGPTTRSLTDEAERRGIPVMRLDAHSLIQLGHGARQQKLRASITGRTPFVAVDAAGDKALTKQLLAEAGVPVPRGVVVRSADEAVREAARLKVPVVVKPLDGNHGRGVSIDLSDADEVRAAFQAAALHGKRVVVEQFFRGADHRILVVDGQVVAAARREPAHVTGDGRRTVAELVAAVNADPRRGEGHEKVMTRIKIDEPALRLLAKSGRTPDSVPEAGRVVPLRETANLSTGGTAVDVTDDIHPDNAAIARRAALTLGLDIAGIDFLCPDITRSAREIGGGVVEVNAAPGFRMHLEPSQGRPRNVARPVIRMLFPPGAPARIPVLAITGTNGKSTTTRMVAHILSRTGAVVGMTSTSGVYIDDERLSAADASGPKSARMILRDPTVDMAVLETARGGILREGLGFDGCDVGCVLNIAADHLGTKGIDTLEELAWVKQVVVEAVWKRGTSVLNFDDPLTRRMARRARGRIGWFSMQGGEALDSALARHVAEGGLAVVREPGPDGGSIVLHDGDERRLLIRAADVPATLEGLAEFNIANALAAACMAHAQGASDAAIRQGLASFTSSFEQTPGRLNVFDGLGFRVILDYAHNPAGMAALRDLILKLRPRYERSIGMISIPGDRRDEDIREMGAIAASCFDELVFRETPDTRGRRSGEVMRLLSEGALGAGFPPERLHKLHREMEAAEACLRNARSGDLVVLTPTAVEAVWKLVTGFKPGRAFRADPAQATAELWG